MITKWDDFPIHQMITTMDHVASSDRRWYDRYWFAMGDTRGEVLVEFGLGVYPNLDVMDGFACATVRTNQYNVRVSRELARRHALP